MRLLKNFLLLLSIALTAIALIDSTGRSIYAYADDAPSDTVEGEEVNVEDEGELPTTTENVPAKGKDAPEETTEEPGKLKSHPDADVYFLFTKPAGMGLELPAGSDVHFLVSFANKGKQDFLVESMEASFRYAMDFSFHLQNFSNFAYNQVVKPDQQTTLSYSLFVSEQFSARPYGFTVNLYYKDAEGKYYSNAVFNETVNIIEIDEGLDGQTFFLYVFMVACIVLIVVLLQQFLFSKRRSAPKVKAEVGTVNSNDVDYDWLPDATLQQLNKSPKAATRQSPRQRKVKKSD